MQNLIIDIGNTAVKAAWAEGPTIGKTFRYQGERVRNFILSLTEKEKPSVMIISSVNEISAHDEYVDSWSDATKKKCCSCYLTILRQSGLLNEKSSELTPVKLDASDFAYYICSGEEWFMEACLLYPYEINDIKNKL